MECVLAEVRIQCSCGVTIRLTLPRLKDTGVEAEALREPVVF